MLFSAASAKPHDSLTLTLSPSTEERERQCAIRGSSKDHRTDLSRSFATRPRMTLPLPFRRGEGRDEGTICSRHSRSGRKLQPVLLQMNPRDDGFVNLIRPVVNPRRDRKSVV